MTSSSLLCSPVRRTRTSNLNAGLASTPIGSGKKNDRVEVARQGFEALMADLDHVVGGDEATKQVAIDNRMLPKPVKAARHGRKCRMPPRHRDIGHPATVTSVPPERDRHTRIVETLGTASLDAWTASPHGSV